jgi:hypothetical protein
MQNAIDLQTKNSEEIDHRYNGYDSVFEGETTNKSPSPWNSCKSLENELEVVLKSPELGKEVETKTTQIETTNELHNTHQNIDHPRRIRRRTSLRTRDLEVLQTRNEIAALAAQEEIFKDTDCGICLLDLDDGQTLHELQTCRHVFHLSCMNECLTSRTNRRVCMKCFVAIPEEECKQICTLARSDKREARIALREQKTQQLIEDNIGNAYTARSLEEGDVQVDRCLTIDDSVDDKDEQATAVIESHGDSIQLDLTPPLQVESQTKEDLPQRSRTIEVQMSQTNESISPITPGSSQIPQDCYGSMIQKMRKRKLDSQESHSPNKARKTNEDQVVHQAPPGTPSISLNDGTTQGAQKDDSVSSSLTYTEELTGRQDFSFDLDIPEERETPIVFDLETKADLNVSFSSIDTSPPVTGTSKEGPYDLKALYGNESDYDPFEYASDTNTSQSRKVKSSVPTESSPSPDYSYLLTLPMFPRHPDS